MSLNIGALSLHRLNQLIAFPHQLQEVVVLQGYRQYKDNPNDPTELPFPDERRKIDLAATIILQTLESPLPTVAVVIRGHADQDLLKHGPAREQFEMDISKRRAKLVRNKLEAVINARASLLMSNEALTQLALLQFRADGFGAKRLRFPPRAHPPLSEHERSMNRRVEIMAARNLPSVRHLVMFCSHGGRLVGPKAVDLESDEFLVVGCNFFEPLIGGTPCMTARFFSDRDAIVSSTSVTGSTFNSLGVPQGPIIVI